MPESNLISPIPEKLNGYPVIRSTRHRNVATVMMARPTSEKPEEFIVATWFPEIKEGWVWGHYFHTHRRSVEECRAEADAAFLEVEKRNEAR